MSSYLDLYDYRNRVSTLYQERDRATLAGEEAATILQHFRTERDHLFATHPQSALSEEQRQHFRGLRYFPHDPAYCVVAELDTAIEPERQQIAMNAQETMMMITIGWLHFDVANRPVVLSLYWLDIYGGGLFLPFRDASCPEESYGGGRYLFDTIKGSGPTPLPGASGWNHMKLDFNYAYNPSCAYNSRWICPLAPRENRLTVPIRAGEMNYKDSYQESDS